MVYKIIHLISAFFFFILIKIEKESWYSFKKDGTKYFHIMV